jgi:hypothetical protein
MGVDARERLRRLSVVFAVELRLMIVSELYVREMSTKRFQEEFGGGSPSRVNKNFEVLEEESWLRYVRSEGPGGDRRGGTEHFYRATEPAFFDRETWSIMPYSVRIISSWNLPGAPCADSQGRGLSGDRLGVEPSGNERDAIPS